MRSVLELTQKLLSFESVTPHHAGSLDYVQFLLQEAGFVCERFACQGVDNLYAASTADHTQPTFCFAGHVDVVPPGSGWRHSPFAGHVENGVLYGRGVVDMKGAIAAFLSAALRFLSVDSGSAPRISVLLTSDEEGPALHGTRHVLTRLQERAENISVCVVGEPTSNEQVGDTLKIGRRGSLSLIIKEKGEQGHVAYPHLADNPTPRFVAFLHELSTAILDDGAPGFDPSVLQITSIDVGNAVSNVIPASIRAALNIRFTPHHTADQLQAWVMEVAKQHLKYYEIDRVSAAEAFCGASPALIQMAQGATEKITGKMAGLSTSGGTSDARFIAPLWPVIECGLLNKTAHKVDEHCAVTDLEDLEHIYSQFLREWADCGER